MNPPVSLADLLQRFDAPGVYSIALMGSYARGEAGPYSDIDFVRFTNGKLPGEGSYLYAGHLVVVSDVTPEQVETWFNDPDVAVDTIIGARKAHILLDRENYFAAIQARAQAFQWSEELQERANHWASEMMVGLIEEVHKGLEGLRRHDIGHAKRALWLLMVIGSCNEGSARCACFRG